MTLDIAASIPADWARTMTDPRAFADEQSRLAYTWTFLGLTKDVENDNDWFRASLANVLCSCSGLPRN